MFVGITDKLNNKIQYILMQESFYFVGLNTILSDLLLQRKRLIKLIMDWMILYRIYDAFNGRYLIGDGIGEGFNGKGIQYFELLQIMIGLIGWLLCG